MEQRGTHPHTGTAGPPFPVPNTFNGTTGPPFPVPDTSASTQPALLIPQSPSNFQETRPRTPSPAPSLRGSKSPLTQTPQPQPAQAIIPLIGLFIWNAANVLMALATSYNGAQTTGQQNQGPTNSMAPLRSMSSDSTTAVDNQPERAFGTTPDQTKSPSTKQTEDTNQRKLEELMEERKPQNLTGKVVILDLPEPLIGGYGIVHSGKLGDRLVAVKMLKATRIKGTKTRPKSDDEIKAEDRNERRLRREISVWGALDHQNICELLGFADDRHDYRVMVSPWYERGSAANLLNTSDLTLHRRKFLTKEVCKGLHYLHQLKIIHGDMKPTNVLVDDQGVAKLCDFGLVKLHDWEGEHGMTTTSPFTGTTRYKAPELFISNENRWPEATFEGDIYSLGCMMVEFIEGVRPFNRFRSSKDMVHAIVDSKPPVLPEETKFALGKGFWILLQMCWHTTMTRRPLVEEVVRDLDLLCS